MVFDNLITRKSIPDIYLFRWEEIKLKIFAYAHGQSKPLTVGKLRQQSKTATTLFPSCYLTPQYIFNEKSIDTRRILPEV
jgi:hypothetical protein